jgi:hypothetical protein
VVLFSLDIAGQEKEPKRNPTLRKSGGKNAWEIYAGYPFIGSFFFKYNGQSKKNQKRNPT